MKDQKNIAIVVLGAILVGAIGFYGGTLYQKSKVVKSFPAGNLSGRSDGGMIRGGGNFSGQNTPMMNGSRGMGFRPVVGEIISKDDKSITVKLDDGSSKIVLFSDSTAVKKSTEVEKSELVVGGTVRVFGTTNTDGSVTASDIELNPERLQKTQNQNTPTQ